MMKTKCWRKDPLTERERNGWKNNPMNSRRNNPMNSTEMKSFKQNNFWECDLHFQLCSCPHSPSSVPLQLLWLWQPWWEGEASAWAICDRGRSGIQLRQLCIWTGPLTFCLAATCGFHLNWFVRWHRGKRVSFALHCSCWSCYPCELHSHLDYTYIPHNIPIYIRRYNRCTCHDWRDTLQSARHLLLLGPPSSLRKGRSFWVSRARN